MKKIQLNTHREARQSTKMIKVMVMLAFFTLILVGSVSALEFDNKLTYSNNDMKINLTNWFGLGNDYGSAELKSHSSVTEIKSVPIGESVVMWYDVNFVELYKDGLGDVEIIDVDTGEVIDKNYQIVYWGEETYQVPNYVCNDVLMGNGTTQEECFQSGTKDETRETWLPYNSKDIPKGQTTLGIKVNMLMDETFDIVWEIGGEQIEKHAVVTSGVVETTEGDYTIFTFSNNGTFNTTKDLNVSILVIAGGGGGAGGNFNGAGGGAGGLIYNNSRDIIAGNYDLFIGTGGAGGVTTANGVNGINSYIKYQNNATKIIETTGGGGGAGSSSASTGGSGGGGSFTHNTGGTGIAGQGNNGGDYFNNDAGGGGGGAGSVGSQGNATKSGDGGIGLTFSINGTSICYAGGGGGTSQLIAIGTATCGGGDGSKGDGENGIDGTGGGGGGAERNDAATGGTGGDGIIIIRVLTSNVIGVPETTLEAPANNTNFTIQSVDFSCGATGEEGIRNITLQIDDVNNFTNSTPYYDFPSDDDFVAIADDNSLDFGTGEFSVSTWVYPRGYFAHGSIFNAFLGKGQIAASRYFTINTDSSNVFIWNIGNTTVGDSITSDNSGLINDWYHVVGTRDSGGVMKLYINGVEQTGTDTSTANMTNTEILYLGRETNPVRISNASLDETRIYNDALTSGEVSSLFAAGRTEALGSVNLGNLVSYWDLGKNNATDVQGSNDGTNTNSIPSINLSVQVDGLIDGDHDWTCEAFDSANRSGTTGERIFNINTTPNIQYGAGVPINEFNSTNDFFEVNVTLTEDFFNNVTFDLYNRLGALNQTVTFTNSSRSQNWTNLPNGNYSYNVTTSTSTNQFNFTNTRNISIDANNPSLEILAPPTTVNFHALNTNLSVNWSINDTNLDTCILEYEGSNRTLTCSDNQTEINITTSLNRIITIYANDTFGNINSTSRSWDYTIFQNSLDFNDTSFETELNNFTVNITYNSTSFTSIETNLYYNSTKHPTTQTGATDDVNFSTTLSRLFVAPNVKPFFWNFRITNITGTFDINSSESQQTEQPILLGLCNATLTTPYVNFTFKDEGNLSILNASVPTSNFVHTLGNFTINKTLIYINNTEAESHTFCLDPPNRTLHTAFSFQYETTGYQQRVVEFAQTFNSTLTTNILYLLSNADGLFVTFQIINTAEQTIPNAIINASRIIDGIDTIVGTGLTNDAGTKTFWLNPNFAHTIKVFKTGFPQFITTLFPDQSAFTINLGGTAGGGEEDYTQGITVDIFPKGTLLDPNDSIVFNYTLTSTFWDIDEFSFGIRDKDGNIYANETASTNGGTLTTTLNTTDNTTLIMDYNWLISGNFTNNSRSWLVYNDTLDDDWSIGVFFSHLTLYIDDGLFGLDDFGLAIITFLTIFIFTGIMSIRYGLVSPAAVTTLMFTLVLFFDVGLGLLTNLNPVGAVPNFPTIIMGIILAGVLLKDGIR